MVIQSTVYRDEAGERKQLTMEGWAAQALTAADNLSKGIVAHECLMMADDDLADDLTPVEQRVFDAAGDIVEAIDEMVRARKGEAKTALAGDCDYEDPGERVGGVEVYLVGSLLDDLPDRYLGDEVAEAVAYAHASPWSSRYERLQDVQDLVEYRQTGSVPDDASEFVHDVISGDSDRWDVADLHDFVADDSEWWEKDVEATDLIERGEDISKTSAKRLPAVRSALDKTMGTLEYEDALETLEMYFSDLGDDSLENYADELVDSGHVEPPVDDGKSSTQPLEM